MKTFFIILIVVFTISCNDVNNPGIEEEPDKSESEGNIWEAIIDPPSTSSDLHFVTNMDITTNSNNEIFISSDFLGIYRFEEDDQLWVECNAGIDGNDATLDDHDYHYFVGSLGCQNENIYAGSRDAIYRSANNGNSWEKIMSWSDYKYVHMFKTRNETDIYAGCYHGILKSSDNGNNWIEISDNVNWAEKGYAYDIEFTDDGTIYVGTSRGILKSGNEGSSWETLGIQEQTLDIEVVNGNEIYAAIYNKLYYTSENSDDWKVIYEKNDDMIHCILINQQRTIFIACDSGLYKTMDNGSNWEKIGPDLFGFIKILYDRKGNLIAATSRNGIYLSKE